jgi:hypothetical protein
MFNIVVERVGVFVLSYALMIVLLTWFSLK